MNDIPIFKNFYKKWEDGFCDLNCGTKDKNWFVAFLRKIFKGENLDVYPRGTVFVKLLEPLKIDLTNGWVLNKDEY